ncbi:hypothetical protein [Kribbella sp. NPDC055071]
MRVLRSVFGVLLALIGLVVAVIGGAAAFWLIGPDDTVHSGDQHLSSKGLAIASTPDLLNRHGPVLHVEAHSVKGQPVFVGVARDFDVASYLKQSAYTSLVQVQFPVTLTTQEKKGNATPLAAPNTLDWWVAKANGAGTQSIAWPIEDGPYDVVVMNADGKTPPDLQVNLGIEIPNAFVTALAVFVAGLILVALGLLLILVRRRRPKEPQPVYPAPGVPVSAGQGPPPPGTYRRVATAGLVIAFATGCSAIPQTDTVAALTRPAVSTEAGVAVVKHYNEVNNEANRRRDDKMIATVEGGNLVRESQAGYTISRALDKSGKNLIKPFTYTTPTILAPSYGAYPMQFVVSAGISDTKDYRYLGLWERASAGSPWMLVFAAAPKTTVKFPELKGLRPVNKTNAAGLTATPAVAATAFAEYLTGGVKSPRAASFGPNADVAKKLSDVAADLKLKVTQPKVYAGVDVKFSVDTPPAGFVTTSGDALVFATVTEEFKAEPGANYAFNWTDGDQIAFSPATVKYNNAITKTVLHDVVLTVPPKGKGKITIASFESQLTAAGGY